MTIVLREMTRETATAVLAGERPGDVSVPDDYPTEFCRGVAQAAGAERQFGPFMVHRHEDDVVVGEIGGAFIDDEGTLEIGYAVVESHHNRGYATAAVEALVARARNPPRCVGSWPTRRSRALKAHAWSRRLASRRRTRWMTWETKREPSSGSKNGS